MLELPAPAAALDRLLVEATEATAARREDRLRAALDRLATARPEHLSRLLAAAVRPALERHHPDGVDSDDLVAMVRGLVGAHPRGTVDPFAVAVVLTGAFGIAITPPDDDPTVPQIDPEVLTRHAILVLAHLAPDRHTLRALLDEAWSEIARSEVFDV